MPRLPGITCARIKASNENARSRRWLPAIRYPRKSEPARKRMHEQSREPACRPARPIEMDPSSKLALAAGGWKRVIPLRWKHGIMMCCVAAVLLPVAVGALLGGLLAALLPAPASRPTSLASEGSIIELSEAYNASGQELFSRLAAAPGDPRNIVFSPYSIGTAMALALS